MKAAAPLTVLCAALLPAALGIDCGQPSTRHPPAVRISNGRIDGLRRRRIANGQEAEPHSFPWMVTISYVDRSINECGGSVIDTQWVLTAAHCVASATAVRPFVTLTFGAHDLRELAGSLSVNVMREDIHVHGNYTNEVGFDIALLKLPRPLTYSDKVRPVCLPDAADRFTHDDGTKFISAGWGRTDTTPTPATLQMVLMQTAYSECLRTRIKNGVVNPDTEFCGEGLGRLYESTCRGDSGAPQVVYNNGRYMQIGLTKAVQNKPCGTQTRAAWFTHIPSYLDWIHQIANIGKTTCKDKRNDCVRWSKAGFCRLNLTWMQKECPKSCGTCDKGDKCRDKNDTCAGWANVGYCDKHPEWMHPNCPKSCGTCDKGDKCHDKNDTCESWANAGYCDTHPEWMHPNCPKSCGTCDKGDKCRDKNDTCAGWANVGYCDTHPEWMHPNCPKSCGTCDKGDKCRDKNDTCASWANAGYCDTSPGWMHPNCPKSCGTCASMVANATMNATSEHTSHWVDI